MYRVKIESNFLLSDQLYLLLQSELNDGEGVELKVVKPKINTRAGDVSVLVAIVGAVGAALGALLTGLLKISEQKKAKSIIIVGKSGRRVEAPVDLPPERLRELIELCHELDIEKIVLNAGDEMKLSKK